MRLRVTMAIAKTTFREFWRSPEAVFWTYGFPLLMAVVLGFAFRPGELPPVPVVVVEGAEAESVAACLRGSKRLAVEVLPEAAADRALARGHTALLRRLQDGEPVLRADPTRPEAEVARLLVERALREARNGPGQPIALPPVADIDEVPCDGRRCGHRRRDEVRAALVALPALEIAVRG